MTASHDLPDITIGGRKYQVAKDDRGYELTGKAGAKYRTIRNRNTPSRMYLYNARDWSKSAPQVWLTDENGKLEVVSCLCPRWSCSPVPC